MRKKRNSRQGSRSLPPVSVLLTADPASDQKCSAVIRDIASLKAVRNIYVPVNFDEKTSTKAVSYPPTTGGAAGAFQDQEKNVVVLIDPANYQKGHLRSVLKALRGEDDPYQYLRYSGTAFLHDHLPLRSAGAVVLGDLLRGADATTPLTLLLADDLAQKACLTEEVVLKKHTGSKQPYALVDRVRVSLKHSWAWYVTEPLKDPLGKATAESKILREPPVFRFLYVLFLLLSLVAMLWLSLDAGISADEERYYLQAQKVYDYYASGGEDKSAITQEKIDPQHYNSQSFDLYMLMLEKWLDVEDPFRMRHLFNAFSGWLMILFASLIALRFGGYQAGLLVILLLFFSPRYLGHSYNNNKDVPIAAAFTWAVYFMLRFFQNLPRIRLKYIALICVGMAGAISIRLSGILLFAYFFAFVGIWYLFSRNASAYFHKENMVLLLKVSAIAAISAVVSYTLGILIWPFALEGPIENTGEVFRAMSELQVSIRQLFEGELISSNEIPWYYTPKYMLITIPVAVLIGTLIGLVWSWQMLKGKRVWLMMMLCFAAFFPIVYAALTVSNDYGGWRHFIFVYGFIGAISAIGYVSLTFFTRKKALAIASVPILLLLLLHPILHIIKNHPLEYVYYNELIGGLDNAYGQYESDYYAHSVRGAVEWLREYLQENYPEDERIHIVSNDGFQLRYFMRNSPDSTTTRYSHYYRRHDREWDYGVFYNTYISPSELEQGLFPPEGTIYTEEVDGKPMAAVVKRPSDADWKGFEAKESGNLPLAIQYFEQYLEADPKNLTIMNELAGLYRQTGQMNKANALNEKILEIDPNDLTALNQKMALLLAIGQNEETIRIAEEIIKQSETYWTAYYQAGIAALNTNNTALARQYVQRGIEARPDRNLYDLLATIYEREGDVQRANAIRKQLQ